MTFAEHLQRYQAWLRSLNGAPPWSRVVFIEPADLRDVTSPAEVPRERLLLPEEFESVFEKYMDGRYAWINLECLGVVDDSLLLSCFVSSRGPAEEEHIPRDRIAVNFNGPDKRTGWDATARIKIG